MSISYCSVFDTFLLAVFIAHAMDAMVQIEDIEEPVKKQVKAPATKKAILQNKDPDRALFFCPAALTRDGDLPPVVAASLWIESDWPRPSRWFGPSVTNAQGDARKRDDTRRPGGMEGEGTPVRGT